MLSTELIVFERSKVRRVGENLRTKMLEFRVEIFDNDDP